MAQFRIGPAEVKAALAADGEIALLDVREHGQYGEGHPFFAVPLPYSRLELMAPGLLPCPDTPLVLVDDDDGVAERAARRLAALGHREVRALAGGAAGWAAAGHELFRGVNLPSKTLGELVEQQAATPHMTAERLQALRDTGARVVQLDGRPAAEYRKMTIPGARCCPNAELGHRLPLLVEDAETPVVINCAGRTRSIIGAQSLINMGVANPVYALENGTQGWQLADLELEHGANRIYPAALPPPAPARSRARAAELRRRFAVPTVAPEMLAAWAVEVGRTLYCFDVRTAEEYAAGHHPLARHAPGGQLVQATDHWVAVRGARIVLVDDTGLRAANTAVWLRMMGHDARVLTREPGEGQVAGDEDAASASAVQLDLSPACAPEELRAGLLADAVQLVDLAPAQAYRRGHLTGARWSIRPRLSRLGLSPDRPVVLSAPDPRLAALAAIDLREAGCDDVRLLAGDRDAWLAAGLGLTASPEAPGDAEAIDHLFFVHDRHAGNLDAARAYLAWEIGLLDQLSSDERVVFDLSGL